MTLNLRSLLLAGVLISSLGAGLAGCSTPEEKAKAHYQSGQELLNSKDYIKAGLEFRNAIKYNEKLADAWYGLASSEEARQNWPVVADALLKVTELRPKDFNATFKLAKLQLAAIKLDNALKNINIANEVKPNDTDAMALRAAILYRLNDREGAIRDAEKSLSLNPDNPDALAVLAADAMASNNTTSALAFVDRGLKADQKNLGLLLFKIKIFETQRDVKKLEGVLREVVSYYPDQIEFRQGLLSFLFSQNRKEEVETEMRKMVADSPKNTQMGLELVRLAETLHGAGAAKTELEKLSATYPNEIVYKLSLARLQYLAKEEDAAFAALKDIITKAETPEGVRQAKLLMADFYRLQSKNAEAEELIKSVLEEDAKNADALALRATMRIEANDADGAVVDLREALNQQPQAVQLMVLLSKAYERQGAIDLANDQFGEALKASKYNPEIALQYITLLKRRGKFDTIDLVLNETVNRNPTNVKLLATLAELRLNKQDWEGAQQVAEVLLKLSPDSGVAKQIVGAAQLGQKKYSESIETLKESYDVSPKSSHVMTTLAIAYLQAGQTQEAEDFIQSVLKANPENMEAMALLGSLRVVQKKIPEAEATFKSVIEKKADFAPAYFSLAKLYLSQKKAKEAEAILVEGRKKAPMDLGASLMLANLFEARGDYESAIKVYDEQLQRTPDVLVAVNNLASLLADQRTDPDSLVRAQNLARRLEAVDIPQFKDTVGWIAYQKGEYRRALTQLEDAAEKLPDLPLVRYHLGLTYAALKRPVDAKAQFAKADELLPDTDPMDAKVKAAAAALGTN